MWKHLLRMLNWILLNRWRRKGVARGSAPQKAWCKTAGEPLARARVRACVACRCSRLLVLARFGCFTRLWVLVLVSCALPCFGRHSCCFRTGARKALTDGAISAQIQSGRGRLQRRDSRPTSILSMKSQTQNETFTAKRITDKSANPSFNKYKSGSVVLVCGHDKFACVRCGRRSRARPAPWRPATHMSGDRRTCRYPNERTLSQERPFSQEP